VLLKYWQKKYGIRAYHMYHQKALIFNAPVSHREKKRKKIEKKRKKSISSTPL